MTQTDMHRPLLTLLFFAICIVLVSCDRKSPVPDVDAIARDYVRLGLFIGQYDGDFVDAYYGPDSLKPTGSALKQFPKDSILTAIEALKSRLDDVSKSSPTDSIKQRVDWIGLQLRAFTRRVRIFSGDFGTFDQEAEDLFGITAPVYPEQHYKDLVAQLDEILPPGKGSIVERYQRLADKFVIPPDKVDTVFKVALTEARKITSAHIDMPPGESFVIEYVTNKPWSGYNWYKGSYQSLIQINTERPIYIDRAIDLACHEGYPGHHVYNALLEKNLYRKKGWVETSLYPLFSPQSFIAEGSANYGIEMAFPEKKFNEYTKLVLLPLAGLDTTGAQAYFNARLIRKKLNYSRNEITRGIVNNTMTEDEVTRWKVDYFFVKKEQLPGSSSFMEKYRSYVICYNYGEDLVREYIEQGSPDEQQRWKKFETILSSPTAPADLAGK
jgi:hypothetical protein